LKIDKREQEAGFMWAEKRDIVDGIIGDFGVLIMTL
jgi:hypothetical protein